MDIIQISVIAVIATLLSITVKTVKPEITVLISVAACIVIILSVTDYLNSIFAVLEELASNIDLDMSFSVIILKVVSIAYISEFSSQICKDAGQTAIASKVELAGKVIILFTSAPVIMAFLEMLADIV